MPSRYEVFTAVKGATKSELYQLVAALALRARDLGEEGAAAELAALARKEQRVSRKASYARRQRREGSP